MCWHSRNSSPKIRNRWAQLGGKNQNFSTCKRKTASKTGMLHSNRTTSSARLLTISFIYYMLTYRGKKKSKLGKWPLQPVHSCCSVVPVWYPLSFATKFLIFSVLWISAPTNLAATSQWKGTRGIAAWGTTVTISSFVRNLIKHLYLVSFWRGKVESWQRLSPLLRNASQSCFEIHWPTFLPTVPALPLPRCTSPNACRHLLHESKHPGFKMRFPDKHNTPAPLKPT